MRLTGRLVVVGCGAAVALLGLALGAQFQDEGFLPPDIALQNEINQSGATGNVVLLTGVLVAAGCALAIAPLALPLITRPVPRGRAWLQRAGALAVLVGGSYLLVNLLQTGFATAHILTLGGGRRGDFANNLLASNIPALPSALLPVFALFLGAILAVLWSVQRLLQPRDGAPWEDAPAPDAVRLLHRQAGVVLLATPFIGLATWGALRLVFDVPGGPPGDPYRIVLPLAAMLLMGVLVTAGVKAWQIVRFLREPRTAPLCQEAWLGAGRAEVWLGATLVMLCLAASLFRPIRLAALETGETFGSDLRRHVQFLLLALVPLLPTWRIHRDGQRLFGGPPTRGTPPSLAWLAGLGAALVLSLGLAGLASFALDGPLWGWLLACGPPAAFGLRLRPIRQGAALLLLTAWSAWCIGNSLTAHYDPNDLGAIQFGGSPGALALWRLLGAALAGLAAARLARVAGQALAGRVAGPLAAGIGLCVVAIALLELPLSIWSESSITGQLVAVGTALASQDVPVQVAMHVIALAAAIAATVMLARLCRPEWFVRRGPRSQILAAPRPIA